MLDASFASRFIANRRCQQIGLDEMFPGVTNTFPWMTETEQIGSDTITSH